MAKPLTSWLVPRFLQHNLRLVVSKRCLHVSVTKLQDKFTSLRRVNNPNSWQTFQTCCTDMYLIRFLPNFAVFCVFLWISRLCDPREISEALTVSFTNWRLKLCIWRLFFSGWSPKGDLRIFSILSPGGEVWRHVTMVVWTCFWMTTKPATTARRNGKK